MKNNGFNFDEYTSIGAILIRSGELTEKHLERALKLQKATHKPLGKILIDLGYCTKDAVEDAIAHQQAVRPPESKSDEALERLWATVDKAGEAADKLHKKTTQTFCVIDLNNGVT